jgi:hypothetical protein
MSSIKYLPVGSLTVDRRVQRNYNGAWARKIADRFSASDLGVFHVSEREDGTLSLLDGQHRKAACEIIGEPSRKVQCKIYVCLSLAEEAAKFRQLNHNLGVSYLDEFFVRLTEQDTVAVAITEACRDNGWEVARGSGVGKIAAMKSLEAVYNGSRKFGHGTGIARVHTVLSVVTSAWGHVREAVDGSILLGLGSVVARYDEDINYKSLVGKL